MEEHRRDQKVEAACALVVTSDARHPASDETGRLAADILEGEGHRIVAHTIVRNDEAEIREAVRSLLDDERVQVVITSGGTGVGRRDRTVDAVEPLLEKRLEGFGEFFRRLSFDEIGEVTILSRATAGVAAGKLVFCLPGSKAAVGLALRGIILPILGHALWELKR